MTSTAHAGPGPDLSRFDLSGQCALVTGGNKGIGEACALALARAGADVAIAGRDEHDGARVAAAIEALGRRSLFISCDVRESMQVRRMVEAVAQTFGRLDIAVNNAGAYRFGDAETLAKSDWDAVIDVNLTGTWLCAQAEMQQMIRQSPTEGKIINVGSIAASIASGNGCAYAASKAAVVHLTRSLAARWGRYNINVNSVSPGYLISAFGEPRSLAMRARLRAVTPLGYVQRTEDVCGAVVFLASRASDFMTGQDLVIDGGQTLNSWVSPLERVIPPRVDPRGEVEDLARQFDARWIALDAEGLLVDASEMDEAGNAVSRARESSDLE